MSSTPAQKFVCPRCRSSFSEPSQFCRECGADMTRASALDAARTSDGERRPATVDRRLTDSNQAWLGKIVDGRYRVVEVIGRGGMGVVYRVEHLRMGKVAAMKVLHRDLAHDAEVIQRFEREAAAVSRLHHPHTVQVFDFGTAQGALYLIMEYVRGLDLSHIIERDGPMPWARAAPLFAQIAGALQEAHELGIVHRDLKPENVLITRTTRGRDYAKVLDFGLAKIDQRGAPPTETDRQQIVGTPYFMAPEQIRGDDVDARTDIYSFGALMFNVLTGQHVYTGSTAVGVLTKHLTGDADPPSVRVPDAGIDPRVDRLVKKALAREAQKRWRTAGELVEVIEEVFRDTVETTGPTPKNLSRALASGGLVLPEDSHSSDLRLRRSDIDAYERGLRRRRFVTLVATLLLVCGAAGSAAWYVTREQPLAHEEREPNDEAAHANKIPPGVPITGYIGKRRSATEGDRDVYLVTWPSGSRRVVTIAVTGLPNLDVNLSVADGDGLHGTVADEGGVGDGEALHRRSVDGPIVISVGETLAKGQMPIENVSDPYTLTVTEEQHDGETEPNNTDADANELKPTVEMRGYLDSRGDVDVLRWTGAPGKYRVVVDAHGIPMTWRIGDGQLRTPGFVEVELQRGDVIHLERTDKTGHGPLPARDAMWSIVVTP